MNEECELLTHFHGFPDATAYLRHRLGIPEGQALDLSAVPDTEERPATGLWVLMALAIQSSPYRMLPLQGIVEVISGSLQFYRNEKKWQVCLWSLLLCGENLIDDRTLCATRFLSTTSSVSLAAHSAAARAATGGSTLPLAKATSARAVGSPRTGALASHSMYS